MECKRIEKLDPVSAEEIRLHANKRWEKTLFLSQIEINSKNNARIIANKIIMQDAKDGHRKMWLIHDRLHKL